jgi:hypothetical protein
VPAKVAVAALEQPAVAAGVLVAETLMFAQVAERGEGDGLKTSEDTSRDQSRVRSCSSTTRATSASASARHGSPQRSRSADRQAG